MNLIKIVILAVLQGITEFLPISSSGHLVLGKTLINFHSEGVLLEVALHFGTLLAILVYFFPQIKSLVIAFFTGTCHSVGLMKRPLTERERKNFLTCWYIVISSIPAALIGFTLEDRIDAAFSSPTFAASMLIITGLFLFLSKYARTEAKDIGLKEAVIIGIAQACAILPGISRSGSTIVAGMFLKINGEKSAEYSFLMAVPVLAGASLKTLLDILREGTGSLEYIPLATGIIVSGIAGYIALKFLLKILQKEKLFRFSFYCLLVGIAGLILT